jgi:hypothetical protein
MSWKGACPADMKPGDEKGPDGTINHFADRERIRSQRGLHPQ